MSATEVITLIVVSVVLVIGVVAALARRIGVAAPLVLTVVGIGVGAVPVVPAIEIEPDIFLTIVLPPLLYTAARQVPFVDFRRNLRVIALLAIGLVALSAVLVGVLVHVLWAAVPLALALALGAVVAPPDAVAATSLGKRLGLPPRIVTILEGEGLVNDATALVLLSTALGIAATGVEDIAAGPIALSFVWAVVGAVLVGGALGMLAVEVRRRIGDGVLDMAIALVVPFAAFLGSEVVGSSGVVAVVVAGIVVGNRGAFRIRAAWRRNETATWRTFTMLVENAVFLLMGVELAPVVSAVRGDGELLPVLGLACLVIAVLVAVRFAVMPLLLWWIRHSVRRTERRLDSTARRFAGLTADGLVDRAAERGDRRATGDERERLVARTARRLDGVRRRLEQQNNDLTAERDQALGWRDGVILGLAGMRGVVTVVAVQTIPHDQPGRDGLVLIAFAVAIVTLLVQGVLLPVVVRRLRPADDASGDGRGELLELRRRVGAAGDAAVDRAMEELGDRLAAGVADEVRDASRRRLARLEVWADADPDDPDNQVEQFLVIRERELEAQRAELLRELSRGAFSSEAIARLRETLDADELEIETLRRNSGQDVPD